MERETKIYEIGYLLSPFIPADKLNEEISLIRKIIEDRQCLITGEGRAKMQNLSYMIKKGPSEKFESAYFGWIKFIASPEDLEEINGLFKKTPNVIRFISLEAAKETANKKSASGIMKKKKFPKDEINIKTEVKPEEIDKKIEELIKT